MSPSEEPHEERLLLQAELDSLSSEHSVDLHLKSHQIHYECGEWAGRFLCYQLKQTTAAGFIEAIKDSECNIITDQQGINDQFKSFYETLYTPETVFNNLEIPSLSDSDKSALKASITAFEIDNAFKKLKSVKAPGPDAYPAEVSVS